MKDTPTDLPPIMTARELSIFLKLSPKNGFRTIQRLAREGKIKGSQVGDLWRFTRDQVNEFLQGHK